MADNFHGSGHYPSPYPIEDVSDHFTPNTGAVAPFTPLGTEPPQPSNYDDPTQHAIDHSESYCQHASVYDTPTAHHRTPSAPLTRMKTRSVNVLRTPMTTPSRSSTPKLSSIKPKKPRTAKKAKLEAMKISEPLSIMTRNFDVPVMDMMTWAMRSAEQRSQEVQEKHKGRIPRPMNSFMLYRTAFKERIKKWGQQGDNNQLISKVAGMSWVMEPADLKDFYARCANLERDNHAQAFPNYKFAPNKTPKKRAIADDDDSDAEWVGDSAHVNKKLRRRIDTNISRSISSTPLSSLQRPQIYQTPPFQPYENLLGPPVIFQDDQGRFMRGYLGTGPYYPSAPAPNMQYSQMPSYPVQNNFIPQGYQYPQAAVEEFVNTRVPEYAQEQSVDPNLEMYVSTVYQYGTMKGEDLPTNLLPDFDNQPVDGIPPQIQHPGSQMLTNGDAGEWPQFMKGPANDFDEELDREELLDPVYYR